MACETRWTRGSASAAEVLGPTKDNAYVNGAFWHLTFQLILNQLQPAQA